MVDQKKTIDELREALKVAAKERDLYIQHLNMTTGIAGGDAQYGAKMLESQSNQIIQLSSANEELDRRSQ